VPRHPRFIPPSPLQPPGRTRPAYFPLAPGFFLGLIRALYGFCIRIATCGVASSSTPPSHWISFLPPRLFSYVFFLLWIVLHVLSLILLVASFTHPARLPGVYTPFTLLQLGMIVFFPYSCYSVTSIRTLCIQPPAEIGFICLIHVSLPLYPVVLPNIPLSRLSPPDSFFPHMRSSSITLIPLAFSHYIRYQLSFFLSSPPSSFWFSPTPAVCIYLALISIQPLSFPRLNIKDFFQGGGSCLRSSIANSSKR
jgi:hypothetical protein